MITEAFDKLVKKHQDECEHPAYYSTKEGNFCVRCNLRWELV